MVSLDRFGRPVFIHLLVTSILEEVAVTAGSVDWRNGNALDETKILHRIEKNGSI